jgi:hypothetical protein
MHHLAALPERLPVSDADPVDGKDDVTALAGDEDLGWMLHMIF